MEFAFFFLTSNFSTMTKGIQPANLKLPYRLYQWMVFQVSRPVPVKIPLPLSLTIKKVSVQFSRSVVSDSLRPHELQHTRPPCPSPTPGVHPNPRRFREYLRYTPSPMDLVTHFRVKMKISVAYKPVQWVWWLINSHCEVPHNGNRIVALFNGEDFSMGGSFWPKWVSVAPSQFLQL